MKLFKENDLYTDGQKPTRKYREVMIYNDAMKELQRESEITPEISKELKRINDEIVGLIEFYTKFGLNKEIPKNESVGEEYKIHQSLLCTTPKVFIDFKGETGTKTKEELKEIKEEYEQNIRPFLNKYAKEIYNLIK